MITSPNPDPSNQKPHTRQSVFYSPCQGWGLTTPDTEHGEGEREKVQQWAEKTTPSTDPGLGSVRLPPTAPNYRLHHSFNANYSDFINFYFSHFDMEWQHSAATRKPCWKPSCWCMINQDKAIKSTAKQTEILAQPIRNTREHPTQWPECNNNNALTTHHIVCPTPVKANYHSWLLWS